MDPHELMRRHLRRYVAPGDVLFATGQGLGPSHDFDLYCVTRASPIPLVHVYNDDGTWFDIFIDDWETMTRKIANYDEIVASFVRRLQPIVGLGDASHLARAQALVPARYTLPAKRRNLLLYRLLVLQGKYRDADPAGKELFRGQLLFPLCLLTFDELGEWPGSPKNWVRDLRASASPAAVAAVNAMTNERAMLDLIDRFLREISDIHLVLDSSPALTFLG